MKEISETGTIKTTVISNPEKNRVYEICRDLSSGEVFEGEEAVLLTLYPTLNNVRNIDLSTFHVLNHSAELGLQRIHFLYLFNRVCSARMSTRGLEVDEEAILYFEHAVKKYKDSKIIIGYGNSMERCQAAIDAKRRIMEIIDKERPGEHIWQIGVGGSHGKENMHPLFLGIRYNHLLWTLEPFDIPDNISPENSLFLPKSAPKKNQLPKVLPKKTGAKKRNLCGEGEVCISK